MAKGDSGFNGQISGPSAGSHKVRVMSIDYPLDIIASADSEARSRRAFYPVVTDGSSFSLVLGFVSWEEREHFNKWLARFMVSISEGSAHQGILTVRCPVRNFVRTGVVQGDIEYGEGLLDVAYSTTLSFLGAFNPTGSKSYFTPPAKNTEATYFYPLGKQIAGAESLEGTLFDPTPDNNVVTTPAEDAAVAAANAGHAASVHEQQGLG